MTLVAYIAVHKPYALPQAEVYRAIHVGRAAAKAELGFAGDDTGDNISLKNPTYCELTALYWMWRNTDDDAYGLAHYRRYFAGSGPRGVATAAEMQEWLRTADVVVARPRRYYIETVRSHYARAHHEADLDAARAAIARLHPASLGAFDRVMRQRQLSLYNMFLMRRELLDAYCEWLFPILAECEKTIPVERYGPQQARVFGYLGERLFNVWLEEHRGSLRVARRRVVNLEPENLAKKAWRLLLRRFGRGRAH